MSQRSSASSTPKTSSGSKAPTGTKPKPRQVKPQATVAVQELLTKVLNVRERTILTDLLAMRLALRMLVRGRSLSLRFTHISVGRRRDRSH